MTGYIVIAAIIGIVVFIMIKALSKSTPSLTHCPVCGKPYGGNPAKCPHCGEILRWKKSA